MVAAIVPGLSRAVQAATTSRVELAVELPQHQQAASPHAPRPQWKVIEVAAGQTLGQICSNLGVSIADMYKVLDYPGARKPLTRLQVGSELAFDIGEHRSEEHPSELQSLMRTSYAVFCLKKKTIHHDTQN